MLIISANAIPYVRDLPSTRPSALKASLSRLKAFLPILSSPPSSGCEPKEQGVFLPTPAAYLAKIRRRSTSFKKCGQTPASGAGRIVLQKIG
jgi:hypothetical protein